MTAATVVVGLGIVWTTTPRTQVEAIKPEPPVR